MERNQPRHKLEFAAVPKPLEVEDRPELAIFPLNILFMSFANIDGVDTSGRALYWPDLETFAQTEAEDYMRYLNQYGQQDYVDLRHYPETGRYRGEKYVNGRNVSSTFGINWKIFFIHLTGNGLSDGERCEFEPLK